jgi:uncharacterized protein YbaA (DUF1428 family)
MYVDGYLTAIPKIKKDACRAWQHGRHPSSKVWSHPSRRVLE